MSIRFKDEKEAERWQAACEASGQYIDWLRGVECPIADVHEQVISRLINERMQVEMALVEFHQNQKKPKGRLHQWLTKLL